MINFEHLLDEACQQFSTSDNLSASVAEYGPLIGRHIKAGHIDRDVAMQDLLDAALTNVPDQIKAQIERQSRGLLDRHFDNALPYIPPATHEPHTTPDGVLNRDQLNQIPPLEPMINGVLDKGTVVMLTAQPAAFKSFLAIDWACCYAVGKQWQGKHLDNAVTYPDDKPADGNVLYIAAEGARGLSGRVAAWEQAWGHTVPAHRFHVLPRPVQLGYHTQVDHLIQLLQEETYGLVIIDTIARCSLGMEENSATDMGKIVDALYRIREAMGPDGTVLAVHHEGKNGGVRGSSALLGGVDQLMSLKRDGDHIILADEKKKDGPELPPMDLKVKPVHDSLIIEAAGTEWAKINPLVEAMRNSLAALLPLGKGDLKAGAGLGDQQFLLALNDGLRTGQIVGDGKANPRYGLGNGDK